MEPFYRINRPRLSLPIGRHPVLASDCPQRHHVRVRPLVPLHPHTPDRQEHSKRLPDLVVQARVPDGVDEHLVNLEGRGLRFRVKNGSPTSEGAMWVLE
jgi:hypothetical protein